MKITTCTKKPHTDPQSAAGYGFEGKNKTKKTSYDAARAQEKQHR